MKQTKFLSASSLRLLAIGLMLVDHMGAVLFPHALWMRVVGRLAFPVFAFQIAEGYRHTKDIRRYALRLLVFGLITEIPFDLMLSGSFFYPWHQNVLLTLLLGLLAIGQAEQLRSKPACGDILVHGSILAGIFLTGLLLQVDYGPLGILTVLVFYFADGFDGAWMIRLTMLAAIHIYGYQGLSVPLLGGLISLPLQGFALLALIPIGRYSGEKGRGGKWLQYGSYLFYPGHMLLLWFLGN